MRYTESELQELKDKNPILEVFREKGFNVVKRGRNYATVCPFHPDKNPSLIITPENNLWNCLGCTSHNGGTKTGGNVFDFLMKHDNVSFIGAVERLRKRSSNQLSEISNQKKERSSFLAASAEGGSHARGGQAAYGGKNSAAKEKKEYKINLQKIFQNVIEFYHKTFSESPTARGYLRKRGITDPSIMETFKVGYANGTLDTTIPESGEIVDVLKEIGLVTETKRELFKDCVVFPIYDEHGAIVNIYGRKIVPDGVKHLYLPGPHCGVFNHHILKSYDKIILTESVIDSLSLYQAGIKNTIPCYGINGLTDDHLRAFKENNTREIIILFDGDDGGRQGAQAVKERLTSFSRPGSLDGKANQISCRIAALPDGEDPNSYLLNHTPEEMKQLIYGTANSAEGCLSAFGEISPAGRRSGKEKQETPTPRLTETGFTLVFCKRTYHIHGIEGSPTKLKAAIKAENTGKFHIDTVELYQSRSRQQFIKDAALLFKERPEILDDDMAGIILAAEDYLAKRKNRTETVISISEPDCKEALSFGKSPDLINNIIKDIESSGYIGEEKNKLLCYLAMSSRKMDDPLSVLIISGSGAGKTQLQDTILRLCPEEDAVKLTSLTGKALFYKQEESLSHKLLAIEEEAGAEEASYAIRNLISSKKLTIEATIKDPCTGRMTTMVNTVVGPTAVFKTTTNPQTDPETRSRFITLSIDESREQTRRILDYQRYRDTKEGYLDSKGRSNIIQKHHCFQRLLRPLAVFNPYAPLLSYCDDRLLVRRDHPKYISIIKAVAFLHQFNRAVKQLDNGTEYIEVTLEDIQIANELAHDILGKSLDELSEPSRRLLELIDEMVSDLELSTGRKRQEIHFTRRELREHIKWSDYQIRMHIKQLVDLEYLLPICGRHGQLFQYELMYSGEGAVRNRFLTGLKSIEQLREEAGKLGIITQKKETARVL